MQLNNKDYEEMLTIAEQCKIFIPNLSYNNKLTEAIFECMKNKKQLDREMIQKAHNNYLAIHLIGIDYCNTETFKKLDSYMDNEY